MSEFSHKTRQQSLARLESEIFDLLIIGGGITGAGIARDASMRGLRVALVEKKDFASGTSSKSSKLIHGGFRYLETYDFHLVYESCRERHLMMKLLPRLAEPIPFLFPFYDLRPLGMLYRSLGMWTYDILAMFRNVHRHQMLKPAQALEAEPGIRSDGLSGAAMYYDCQTNDAWLTMAILQDAHRRGAVIVNYTGATELKLKPGESKCTLKDEITDTEIRARAKVVVNASGPWMDKVRQIGGKDFQRLQTSKGTHLILDRHRISHERSVLFSSPDDGRVLLIIPAGNVSILGTTELSEDVDSTFSNADEVDYLLRAANHAFPGADLTRDDVWCTYAGHRPLIKSGRENLTSASRKHEIFQDDDGLISIGGGKLTTHRAMAEEAVDIIVRRLGKTARRCRTAGTPLEEPIPEVASQTPAEKHLNRRYGQAVNRVVEIQENDPSMAEEIVPGLPYTYAELDYCIQSEMVMTLDDFLGRRVPLLLEDKNHGLEALEQVAARMQSLLGWSNELRGQQVAAYQKVVRKSLPHFE
ncbi:MAG: glycerol-3-phosphate dehydrogenase/oxidase [Planctomycetota bacterium]|nr:glycerol-3-phosphate dehydrogenase/oxidase [Planctomycetota bacterium]